MQNGEFHRKLVKHFDTPGDWHELTFSCYRRRPLLTNDTWRAMLSESITRACALHGYALIAFVYMPEHVHLLVYPHAKAAKIQQFLFAIKRPFAYRVKQQLQEYRSPLLAKLTIRQRPGVLTFRYWQEGPGYDRNFDEPATIWKSFHYIHNNPVKRGLCKQPADWKWSSARYYERDPPQTEPTWPQLTAIPWELANAK